MSVSVHAPFASPAMVSPLGRRLFFLLSLRKMWIKSISVFLLISTTQVSWAQKFKEKGRVIP